MEKIKIVFMGTSEFACPILEGLIENYNVSLVVSQPDRKKDKKGNLIMTPTKELALKHNIEVFQPIKIKDDYDKVLQCNPDLIVTCAYGQIIDDKIINFPKYGCINVHGSLLPKLRGGAPIHWAIINGDKKTGITIMYMNSIMDGGDIIAQEEVEILDTDILDTLYEKMSYTGKKLLLETIPKIINKEVVRIKQDEKEVTFGYNIKKEQEKIDFNNKALDIHNLVRGLNSNPLAYAYLDGKRLKIYETIVLEEKSREPYGKIVRLEDDGIVVTTRDKLLKITEIKLEGKNKCRVEDYLNGIKKEELIGKILT